jgi:hypothetical protein
MRIKFQSTDVPKKAAKRLKNLLAGMPGCQEIPSLSLSQSQEAVAVMLGYSSWYELTSHSKRSAIPSPLDEELDKVLTRSFSEVFADFSSDIQDPEEIRDDSEITYTESPQVKYRSFYQAGRLSKHLGLSAIEGLVIGSIVQVSSRKPTAMSSYSKNTYKEEICSDEDGIEYLSCSFTPSPRSKVISAFDDSVPELPKDKATYGLAMDEYREVSEFCPEFLNAYLWQFHAAVHVNDTTQFSRLLKEITAQLEAFIPEEIFKAEVKARFSLEDEYNERLCEAVSSCLTMAYTCKDFDEARKWRAFLRNRFPDHKIGSLNYDHLLPES